MLFIHYIRHISHEIKYLSYNVILNGLTVLRIRAYNSVNQLPTVRYF